MFKQNEFYLMNKDDIILSFNIVEELGEINFTENKRFSDVLPVGFININQWIEKRQAPKHRQYIEKLLRECGCYDLDGFIRITHALSLNDTYWAKPIDSNLKWNEVSLYKNEFDKTIARIAFEGGLYGKNFTTTSPEFGTSGAFAKCWIKENENIYLLKRGSEGASNSGLEIYSELYSSQLSKIICNDSVDYSVISYHDKLASKCKLFTSEQEGFFNISNFFKNYKDVTLKEILEFLSYKGLDDDFRRMCVLDALIINTDRHMGNYGLMVDNDDMDIVRFAPIFDNNQALLPYALSEDLKDLDSYLSTRPTKIGADFNAVANQMLTPSIKADLINLKGFTFEQTGDYNLPKERIDKLNYLVNMQIDKILKGIRLFYPSQLQKEESQKPKKH